MVDPNIREFETHDNSFMDAVSDAEAEALTENLEDDVEESEPEEEEGEEEEQEDDRDADESDDDESDDEEEEDEEPDEDEDEEEDDSEAKEKVEEEVKTYKATKSDGSQLEIEDDTTLKIKVDGKFKRVSVRELKDNYNGEVKHEELLRRTSEARKRAEAELSELESKTSRTRSVLNRINAAITKGNVIESMGLIAELSGQDSAELMDSWANGLGGFIQQYATMSDEEREKFIKSHKLDSELKSKEQRAKEMQENDQKKAAKQFIDKAKEEYELEDEEINNAYQGLVNQNEALKQKGQKPINFSLNDIVLLALDYKTYNGIRDVAEAHDIELTEKDSHYLLKLAQAEEAHLGRRLKEKDVKNLISKHVKKELKDLSRKVGAKKAKTSPKSKRKTKKRKKLKEISRDSQVWEI